MKIISILLLLIISVSSFSQVGVGQWRDHLPYSRTIDVCDGGDIIYCATAYSLFSYDKTDNSVERITKVNKLSDTGLTSINYDKETSTLLIGYSNGNLDFIVDGRATNLADIKTSNLVGDKSINEIHFYNGNAYLACGFGVVVIDMEKIEVSDTYFIGDLGTQVFVNDINNDDTHFYAASSSGVYKAEIDNPFLANFQSWTKVDNLLNNDGDFVNIEINDTYIILQEEDEVEDKISYLELEEGLTWLEWPQYTGGVVRDVYANNEMIIVSTWGNYYAVNMALSVTLTEDEIDGVRTFAEAIIEDQEGNIWMANSRGGLLGISPDEDNFHIEPSGPARAEMRKLEAFNNNLWIASSGVDNSWTSNWNSYGIYGMVDENWYNFKTFGELTPVDYMGVAINPTNPDEVYLGTWVEGLIHVKNKEIVNIFNETNSSLELENFGGSPRIGVAGLSFDESGNLWFTSHESSHPIHLRNTSGDFSSFTFEPTIGENDRVVDILASRQGYIWAIVSKNGLLVLDTNDSPSDQSDDNYIHLINEEGLGGLPTLDVLSIEEDLDGEIWVGTLQGITVFYSPQSIFEGDNFDAQQILITQDGNVQILLETESVNSIEIDGANRKWVGTQNSGVFLFNEDGTEEIFHFTTENSPLLSDNVFDIAINHESGEVFFGTEKGIVGFKADATNFYLEMDDISVYPNPIRPEYEGVVTIDGLSRDVDVKISDISGNIVYQTRANGGRATWNGKTFNGERVSSGIYLVFISNDDGSSKQVSKIAFIN